MEVWILLAAAGSGYLARRWQNSQRPKELSSDEAEDDNRASSSHNMPSSRGPYRHFSSSASRQVGKSMRGKGSSHWVRPKSTGNLMEIQAENKPMAEEIGKKSSAEDHACNIANGCKICSDCRAPKVTQNRSIVQLDDVKNESTDQEGSYHDSLPGEQQYFNSAGNLWKERKGVGTDGLEWDTQEEDTNGQGWGNSSYSSLLRSMSGKRPNENFDEKLQQSVCLYQDGCAEKRMKDALDSSNTAKLSEGCILGSWMPGVWDVSEGMFVLDTGNILGQQWESNRGSYARKSRTPSKHGRNKGFRKKRLAGQKPMSSLESCLLAQLGEDYPKQHLRLITQPDDDLPEDSGNRSSRHSASIASGNMVYVSKTEFAIGLPSLSRMPSSKRFPSKARTPRISFDCKENSEEPFNPFGCGRCESASSAKWDNKGGRSSSSVKGLLFNFGVGVGMMFMVMSNMREVRRLTLLLKEAESLIEDLENELERRDESKFDLGFGKDGPQLKQRQNFVANTLRKVKSATEFLCSMQTIGPTEPEASLTIERAPSKDISKLEAELEAELARMELSLDDEDNLKPQNRSSKVDGEVENVVHGELTICGLPQDASSDKNSSNSSHEDLHPQSYAVSPRALTKRLHEVLEAQQEEKICELEAELKSLSSKLQAKEEEARWLKENFKDFRAIAVESQKQRSSPIHSQQKGSHGKEPLSPLKLIGSSNPSPSSPYTSSKIFNDVSLYKKGIEDKSTAFITLGGEALEAYEEACDELSKLSMSGSENAFIDENRLSGEGTCAQEGRPETKHLGCSEGWEQVDLLSLAQDFYGGGGHELLESIPISSKGSIREGRKPRRKSRIKGHPEPENSFSSLRVADSSDDGTNDTSGSTPCSIKFMDVRTADYCQNNGKQGDDKAGDALHPTFPDWNPEILIRAGVNTPNQEGYEAIHTDTDYFSEVDHHLGQMLTKRVVEKSRQGSPILRDAQTVLAKVEKNEPVHVSDEHEYKVIGVD